MRRWNGWGDDGTHVPLPEQAERSLIGRLGRGRRLPDAKLEEVTATVPPSRIAPHRLVMQDAETRVRHARGQSLPDWLAAHSGAFDVFPDGVAFPESGAEVRELLDYARAQGASVIPYGGGTSVAGHITPEKSQRPVLTVALTRMCRLLDLDSKSQLATFGAGAKGPDLEAALRARGYTLGHFPQSFELSTVGGWVATRSSGQQSLRYGRIEQMFAGATVETPVGRLEIPAFPASSTGPDMREIILGSEGRFGIIAAVRLRVSRLPEVERFYVSFFPGWDLAEACLREMVQTRIPLSMLRLSSAEETAMQLTLAGHGAAVRLLHKYLALRGAGEGKCMLVAGITGTRQQVSGARHQFLQVCERFRALPTGTRLGERWKRNRFLAPYLRNSLWGAGFAVDTLETAAEWRGVKSLLEAVEAALRDGLRERDEKVHVFSHLSHLHAQGSSIYTTYIFRNGPTYSETLERWRMLKRKASEAIVSTHGTISHHHGVGIDHAPYLAFEKGPLGMATLRQLCAHFDPSGMMNPGKLVREGI